MVHAMTVAETVAPRALVSTSYETRSDVANRLPVCDWWLWTRRRGRGGEFWLLSGRMERCTGGSLVRSDKEVVRGKELEPDPEAYVPLSVREARRARKMRGDLWPYVWMNFASILILAATLAILTHRIGAQSRH